MPASLGLTELSLRSVGGGGLGLGESSISDGPGVADAVTHGGGLHLRRVGAGRGGGGEVGGELSLRRILAVRRGGGHILTEVRLLGVLAVSVRSGDESGSVRDRRDRPLHGLQGRLRSVG